ncbi:MAG: guanine deaminase [Byssovorax sp.]
MSAIVIAPPRAYRGRILTPASGGGPLRFLDDGLLVVHDGRIVSVDRYAPGLFPGAVRDLRPCVLLPGFIDTHVHFPQTRVIGSASGPLLDWLSHTVFPEETKFNDVSYAREVAAEFCGRLLAAGTTTSSIFSSSSPAATDVLFEALSCAGLRAFAGLTLMDQACPPALALPSREALAACEELIHRWHGHDGGRLAFAVTPRFALSCSRPLLEGAAHLASTHKLLVQTHIAENPAEGEAVLAAHPWGGDYLGIYEHAGLLARRTLLAHAIHLSPREWDRAATHHAAVAHCPDSNFFLGSGRMPLGEARSRGIAVGLGSDVAAGRSFEMRKAMAHAYDNALCLGERLSPDDLLTMATLGGAAALGIDAVTGSLEPGKEADFLALRLPDYVVEREQILSQLVFGDAGKVERTFVRGKQVFAG